VSGPARHLILVVDDDPDILDVMRVVLESVGYAVQTATNGREALDALRGGERPDVVLLDLMMPIANGWWFREQIGRDPALATIPIIVLSGARITDQEITQLGVRGFLKKPVMLEALLSIVERCLSG
jgi:CheY-like chemotaxis protein